MRHDFPSGAWAELRPLADLRGKDKRLFEQARLTGYVFDADGDVDYPATNAALGVAARRALFVTNALAAGVALAVTGWSFDVPLPVIDPQARTVSGGQVLDDDLSLDDLSELEGIVLPYILALQRQADPKAPAAATTTRSAQPSSDAEVPQQA